MSEPDITMIGMPDGEYQTYSKRESTGAVGLLKNVARPSWPCKSFVAKIKMAPGHTGTDARATRNGPFQQPHRPD